MRLKRTYGYLGDASTALNDRAIARCPSCCPPTATVEAIAQAVGTPIEIAGVTNITYLDTVAMDAHRYIIAAIAGGAAGNKGVWVSISRIGLSDTRFPVAYVSSANTTSRTIRTFTFEFGNG